MVDENLKQWILKHKLQNYGYDYKFFKKMSQHKSKLKSKIKVMSDAEIRRNLANVGIIGRGGRLERENTYKKILTKTGKEKYVKQGKKRWNYTTGQSFNEELVNIMQLGSGNKESFWDTQNRWME